MDLAETLTAEQQEALLAEKAQYLIRDDFGGLVRCCTASMSMKYVSGKCTGQ